MVLVISSRIEPIADTNVRTTINNGMLPLMVTSLGGQQDAIRRLLGLNADADVKRSPNADADVSASANADPR